MSSFPVQPISPLDGRYRAAAYDHRSDAPVSTPEAQAAPGDILVFDGIFLHRPELRPYWDCSVFLEVDVSVSMARCAASICGCVRCAIRLCPKAPRRAFCW